MQGRQAKKMTQAQLAQAINEKKEVINKYENGKAIPNGQVCFLLADVLWIDSVKSC